MAQIQQTINTLHTLFIVCLVLCAVFLVLSVVFFFVFDIKNTFNMLTGRSVKKTVKEMNEQNEKTGQLRRNAPQTGQSKRLNKVRRVDIQNAVIPTGETNVQSASPGLQPDYGTGEAAATAVLPATEGMEDTIVLQTAQAGEGAGTTVLSGTGGTTVLGQSNAYSKEIAQSEVDEKYGKFEILTSVLMIHTNEAV